MKFQSLRLLIVLSLLTGILYPALVFVVGKTLFPRQAEGSILAPNGSPVGSKLLAQKFESPRYFWPRPSAADYATVPSGASNFAPTNKALKTAVEERRAKFGTDAPVEMLTASGSGLDPDISPEAAILQVGRVATARQLPTERVASLVADLTQGPQFGLLGEKRVNVLALNLALDALK